VAGYQTINGTNVASYWKNNVPVLLSAKASNAYDSSGQSIATYWKNGVVTHIGNKRQQAYSIFAKTRQSL